jgi:hypothetical protein
MDIKALKVLRDNGSRIEIGATLTLDDERAQALINEGAAEAVGEKAAPKQPEKTADELAAEAEKEAAEARAKVYKALDAQYKVDDLKAAAQGADVEFTADAKKADVINAIIDQGKAEQLLK